MKQIKKVTLVGMGAMGSFFAPRLSRELGSNFRLLAGGERKERLESRGVTLNGVHYHFPVITPETEDDPADLVILAVKGTGLTQALLDMHHQVGKQTWILPILNGVESEEKTAAIYGWEKVLYSYMRMSIVMKDGVADFDPNRGKVYFGERENRSGEYSERVLAVKELFDTCQIPYEIEPDMLYGIWLKFSCNVAENLLCAVARIPFGAFQESEDVEWLRMAAMREVGTIAQCKGITITEDTMLAQRKYLARLPYENIPSTLQDLEQGKPTEVDMFAGAMIRMGREYGIPTPISKMYYHLIRIQEAKNRGEIRYQ